MSRPRDIARRVLATEAAAVEGLIAQLDESFDEAVELMAACRGRVVCTGMGKSGLVLRKVAATLASTGTPALFLHPAEAIHGDLGMLAEGDVVLAASYSGSTEELVRLAEILQASGHPDGRPSPAAPTAPSAGWPTSTCRRRSTARRARWSSRRPPRPPPRSPWETRSPWRCSTAKGFSADDFKRLHPGGSLGRKLLRVAELMHTGDELPRVRETTSMPDALYEMSSKRLGITAVVDADNVLLGCLTDGDLRRLLAEDSRLLERAIGECMHPEPRVIGPEELASAALKAMEDKRITSLFVCDGERKLVGLVHLHDLWQLELF